LQCRITGFRQRPPDFYGLQVMSLFIGLQAIFPWSCQQLAGVQQAKETVSSFIKCSGLVQSLQFSHAQRMSRV